MTKPYHHGDLRAALLAAAEAIVNRDGVAGLTLRGVAREVGASHAAPKNHFDDLTGLLSELAAIGFTRLAARLQPAPARAARAWSMVHGYAILLLDDRLNPLLDAGAPREDALALLDDMLTQG